MLNNSSQPIVPQSNYDEPNENPTVAINLKGAFGEEKVQQISVTGNRVVDPEHESYWLWKRYLVLPGRIPDIATDSLLVFNSAALATCVGLAVPPVFGIMIAALAGFGVIGVVFGVAQNRKLRPHALYRSFLVGCAIALII